MRNFYSKLFLCCAFILTSVTFIFAIERLNQELSDLVYINYSASKTENFNEFDISLDVISSASIIEDPIDIMFVLDKSDSMRDDWESTTNYIKNISKLLLNGKNNVQIGITTFGSSSNFGGNLSDVYTEISNFNYTKGPIHFTSDYERLERNILLSNYPLKKSGRPTFLGIEAALETLNIQGRENSKKYIVLITNGPPTFKPGSKYVSLENRTSYYEGRDKYLLYQFTHTYNLFEGVSIEDNKTTLDMVESTFKHFEKLKVDYAIDESTEFITIECERDYSDEISNSLEKFYSDFTSDNLRFKFDNEDNVFESLYKHISNYTNIFKEGYIHNTLSEYVEVIPNSFHTNSLTLDFDYAALDYLEIIETPIINADELINENAPEYALDIENYFFADEERHHMLSSNIHLDNYLNNRLGYNIGFKVRLKDAYIDGKSYPVSDSLKVKNVSEEYFVSSPLINVDVVNLELINIGYDNNPVENGHFELYENGVLISNHVSGKDGVINLSNLTENEYILKEVIAPIGHELMEEVKFKVNNDLSTVGLDEFLVNGQYLLKNELSKIDFNLSVIDQYEIKINDLIVELVGDEYTYDLSVDNQFEQVDFGEYTLRLTDHNNMYVVADTLIKVSQDGHVSIDDKRYPIILSDNTNYFDYEVQIIRKGILPRTGSGKRRVLNQLSLLFISTSILILLLNMYRKYSKRFNA